MNDLYKKHYNFNKTLEYIDKLDFYELNIVKEYIEEEKNLREKLEK